jgi:hypothetical protein
MDNESKSNAKAWIAAVIFLIVFGIAYAAVLKLYSNEGEKRSAVIDSTDSSDPNRIEVFARLVNADFNKGDLSARLEFAPHGALATDDGHTLNRDLKVFINGSSGKREFDFPKGKRMNPIETTLDLYDGQLSDYPFDRYKADLEIIVEAAKSNKPAAPKEGEESNPSASDEDDIPVSINFEGAINGLEIKAAKDPNPEPGSASVDIQIKRAPTSKFFSFFIMGAQWLLTLAALFLTLRVAFGGRKIEVGMFSFLGALLFAFPALRNSQPGVPPIGAFGDFIAFFWAETLIAVCLLTILTLWLVRPQMK